METVTKNGVTYTPTSDDAALTYDSSGNVTGISKGTVEVTLENSTDPKITLDGSTAFSFTAESTDGTLRIVKDSHSFNYVSGKATYSAEKINFPAGNVGVKLNNAIFSSILGTINVTVPSGGLDVPFNSSGAVTFNLPNALTATVSGGTASGSISLSGSITYNAENKAITLAKDAAVSINDLKLTEYSTALNFGITANSDSTLAIDGLYFVFKDGASVNIKGSTFGLSGDVTLSGGDLSFGLLHLLTGQVSEFTLSAGTTLTTTIQGLSVNISATNDATTSISMANNVVSLTTSDDNGVNVSIGSLAAIPINIKGTVKIDIANHAITFTKDTVAKVTLPSGTVAQITANDDATSKFEIASDGTITLTPNEGDGTLKFKLLKSKSSSKRLLAASSDDSDYETTLDADIEVVSGSISFNLSTFHLDVAAGTVTKLTMGDYVFTTSNSKNAGGTISFTDEGGITYTPDSDDGGLTITVEGTGDSQFENVVLEALSGSFTLNADSTFSIAKDTELKLTFSDDYSISFKTTDEAGGTLALVDNGITFTPGDDDGHLELTVTNGDTTRTASLEMTGTVTYTFGGNIELAEGTVVKNVFEDGNELTITANTDASGIITFNPEGGLTITPSSSDALNVVLTDGEIEIFNITSIKGSISYQDGTVTASDGSEIRFTNYFFDENEMIMSTNGGESSIKFGADGTSYIAGENTQFVLDCQDGETLELQNGTFIDNYGNTATITAGSIFKTNDFDPIYILETAGTYTLNGNEITTTADNVEVYLPNGDTVTFDASAAVALPNGYTVSGDASVSITNNVASFGVGTIITKTFENGNVVTVTVNLDDDVKMDTTEDSLTVTPAVANEITVTYTSNNTTVIYENIEGTITYGESTIIFEDGTHATGRDQDGNYTYDYYVTGGTYTYTMGESDVTYTLSEGATLTAKVNENTLTLSGGTMRSKLNNSGIYLSEGANVTTNFDGTFTLETAGTYTLNGNKITTTADNVEVSLSNGDTISFDAGAGVIFDGKEFSGNGTVSITDGEISFVMTEAGEISYGDKTFELTEDVESGVTVTLTDSGFEVSHVVTAEEVAYYETDESEIGKTFVENVSVSGDKDYTVTLTSFGVKELQNISKGVTVTASAELDGETYEDGTIFDIVTDSTGKFTFGDKTYTISDDDSVRLRVFFANDGTAFLGAIGDLSDEGNIQIGDSILSSGVVINSAKAVQIIGTDEDDTITSTGHNVTIESNAGNDLITASGRNLSIDAGEGNDSLVAANSSVSISTSTINLGEGEDVVDFAGILNQVTITGAGATNNINIGTLRSPIKNSSRTFNTINLTNEDAANISIDKMHGAGLMLYLNNTSGEGSNNVSVGSFEGNKNIFFESVSGAVANNVIFGDINGKNNFVAIEFGPGNANFGSNNDSITIGDIAASNEFHMWLDGGNDNVTIGEVGKKVSIGAVAINSLTAEIGDISNGGHITFLGGNAENNITTGNLGASVSFYADLQDGNDNVQIGDVGKKSNVTVDGGGGADTFEFNDIYGNVTVTSGEPKHINRVDTLRNPGITAESIESTAETNAIDLTISTVKAGSNVEITGGEDADKVSIGFVELGTLSAILGAGNDSIYIDAVSKETEESKVAVDAGAGDNYIKLDLNYKDTITSGSGNDLIEVIRGSHMNVSTGAGNDTILGVLSTADLETEEDNWTFGGKAIIDAGAGDDYISPHYSDNSSIYGGAGNDTIINNGQNTTINGGAGNDYIELTNNFRANTGDYEGQVIEVSAGNDSIYGVNEKTSVAGTFTSSSVDGDNVILTSAEGTLTIIDGKGETFYINGAETTIDENMTALNIKNSLSNTLIEGTELNDTISNTGDNVTIDSGSGNDSIFVVADNVSINTGDGNNTVYGVESKQINITTGDGDNYIYNTYVKYDEEKQAYVNYDSDTASTIITGAGNDTIANEGMYQSSVDAGEGDNVIGLYHSYENTVTTGAGDDSVIVGRGHKLSLMTGAGNDTIQGTLGAVESSDWAFGGYSTVDAGKGNDYIAPYYTDNSSIYGGAGNDTIIHNGKNTTINGGAGNDYIEFTNNYDTETRDYESAIFVTSLGNDTIKNYSSIVTLQGTFKKSSVSGNDVVLKTAHGTLTILDGAGEILNLNGVESVVGEKLAPKNINNRTADTLISGSSLDDTVKNSGANVTIQGYSGNDSIKNSGANALIYGDDDNDKISLSSAAKNNTIYAGEGDDSIIGGGGNNLFVYEGGNDYISAYKTTDTLQIASGEISSATLSGSNVIFTVGEDNITLKGAKNKTINLIDADGNSFSTIIGGTSTESTITDSDQSIIKADRNALVIDASSRTEDLQITGNSKANTILGGSGNDTIDGGAGSDSIFGNDGADKIKGGAGNDSMYGGAGADYLEGNSGKDYLEGGAGNDTLDGGAAADTLTGGAGHDLFVYSAGKDVITDYTAGADKIQISKGKISDTSYDGDDVIFKIGTGSLTVQNGNNKAITIIDSSGNETTKTYDKSNSISWGSRTLDLLYDNNFLTDDAALDDITEAKYSVTDIQDNNVEDLAQDSTILTYGEDK